MPLFDQWRRPGRPAAGLRARLSLASLDDRAAPSALAPSGAEWLNTASWDATAAYVSGFRHLEPVPTDEPPQIVDFVVVWIEADLYRFSGRVVDEAPGGLGVGLGGIPSAEGRTATTNADGTFSTSLTLKTDGTDSGNATAVTSDAAGQSSNVATYWVDPR